MIQRVLSIALAALSLSACDSYPRDLAPLDRGWLGRFAIGCANISGTYLVDGPNVRANRVAFRESFLHDQLTQPSAFSKSEWITIAGNARDSLVVTVWSGDSTAAGNREWQRMQDPAVRWSSEFARMSDVEYARVLEQLTRRDERRRVLHRGWEYECGGGWVRGPRTVHDPGPDSRTPRPDTVIGEVLLARTTDGGLAAQAVYAERQEFTVWCGDGCRGIPLGTWTTHEWAYWAKGEPFTRPPDPRRWAVARPHVDVTPAPSPTTTHALVDDRSARATNCANEGIHIYTWDSSDRRVLTLGLSFTTQAALSRFLKALDDDSVLTEPRIVWIKTQAGGGGDATVTVLGAQ